MEVGIWFVIKKSKETEEWRVVEDLELLEVSIQKCSICVSITNNPYWIWEGKQYCCVCKQPFIYWKNN